MNQVLRKGFKDIVVTEVPDPALNAHHVLVRPCYSLISSGTETASIHPDVLKTVKENPSHIQTIINVAKVEGPVKTFNEVRAKFDAYADAIGTTKYWATASSEYGVGPAMSGMTNWEWKWRIPGLALSRKRCQKSSTRSSKAAARNWVAWGSVSRLARR